MRSKKIGPPKQVLKVPNYNPLIFRCRICAAFCCILIVIRRRAQHVLFCYIKASLANVTSMSPNGSLQHAPHFSLVAVPVRQPTTSCSRSQSRPHYASLQQLPVCLQIPHRHSRARMRELLHKFAPPIAGELRCRVVTNPHTRQLSM